MHTAASVESHGLHAAPACHDLDSRCAMQLQNCQGFTFIPVRVSNRFGDHGKDRPQYGQPLVLGKFQAEVAALHGVCGRCEELKDMGASKRRVEKCRAISGRSATDATGSGREPSASNGAAAPLRTTLGM
jgi:hypothetical protein